jgi:hypothetical protein
MEDCRAHILDVIARNRDDLVREATDVAFLAGETPIPRADGEQMIRGVISVIEEGIRGESDAVRSGFLAVMPDIARATTWELLISDGLPCWGVILCKLITAVDEKHRANATVVLSQFLGGWWRDVAKVTFPVYLQAAKAS